MKILIGSKPWTSFLRSQRNRFASAPILLIASSSENTTVAVVDEHNRKTSFVLQQQMSLNTVVSPYAGDYTFPTVEDVEQVREVISRVGVGTVAAVGSGRAMDLAKAVYSASQPSGGFINELVLIPSTPGACIPASSSSALLLDPETELLVPIHLRDEKQRTVALTNDGLDFSLLQIDEVRCACVCLLLDTLIRRQGTNGRCDNLSMQLSQVLNPSLDATASLELLLRLTEDLSYGMNDSEPRSIPITLTASLLPKFFSVMKPLTFFASLAPSLYRAAEENGLEIRNIVDVSSEQLKQLQDLLEQAPQAVTTEPMEALLAKVKSMSHHNDWISSIRGNVSDVWIKSILTDHVF